MNTTFFIFDPAQSLRKNVGETEGNEEWTKY